MKKTIQLGAAALVLVMTAAVGAQDKPAPAAQDKPAAASGHLETAQVPVKIQLVLSRYQGEKKLSSVPYLMWVTAGESRTTSLRMGVKIPVYSGGDDTGAYNYQDVGTNIDCSVLDLRLMGSTKSISPSPTRPFIFRIATRDLRLPPTTTPPAFRSFTSTFSILLRDGQTGQYTSVTDQASGEVLKIDATLNVLK